MRLPELILMPVIAIAIAMKMERVAGGSQLLILSISALACFYLLWPVIEQYKARKHASTETPPTPAPKWLKHLPRITFFALAVLLVSVLQKIQFYSLFATVLTYYSLVLLALAVAGNVWIYRKSRLRVYFNNLKRLVLVGGGCLLILLTPTSFFIKWEFQDYPAVIESHARLMEHPNEFEAADQFRMELNRVNMSAEDFRLQYPDDGNGDQN